MKISLHICPGKYLGARVGPVGPSLPDRPRALGCGHSPMSPSTSVTLAIARERDDAVLQEIELIVPTGTPRQNHEAASVFLALALYFVEQSGTSVEAIMAQVEALGFQLPELENETARRLLGGLDSDG